MTPLSSITTPVPTPVSISLLSSLTARSRTRTTDPRSFSNAFAAGDGQRLVLQRVQHRRVDVLLRQRALRLLAIPL